MSSVFVPRRARAAARFIAVVVLPTPPFWLTIARTCPTLLLGVVGNDFAVAQRRERVFRVSDPPLGCGAGRGFGEKGLEVLFRAGMVAAFQEQERQPIVRAGQV